MNKLALAVLAVVGFILAGCQTGPDTHNCGNGFYWDQGTGRCIPNGDSSKK